MLKTDLHIHTKEDCFETSIKHDAKAVIDRASKLGFKVLSITNHGSVYYNRDISSYARRRGILLIPGAELFIGKKHVLAYGIDNDDVKRIRTFDDLERARFVIAPHPFFGKDSCLGNLLVEHKKRFDAVEYCHFYTRYFNLNRRAMKIAHELRMPVVGNSDAHDPMQFNKTYSLIDAEPKMDDVFEAIRKFRVRVVSKPLSSPEFLKIAFKATLSSFYHWKKSCKIFK